MDIFSNFGIPHIVVADNVPFNSFECHQFAKRWEFKIVTSSPRYPRSNGLAEKAVGIIKNIFRKCKTEEEIRIALLENRNTPTKNIEYSPAELLMNRRLKTKLPINNELLKSKINKDAYNQILNSSMKNKTIYDRNSRFRRYFNVNEKVRMQTDKMWRPAKIVSTR